MPATQERYFEMLMERVRTDRYPSHQLMDRIEASLWRPEQLHAYVELLIDKASESWYPSGEILDRVQRLLAMASSM